MVEHADFMKSIGIVGERLSPLYKNATPLPLRITSQDLSVQRIFEHAVDAHEPLFARFMSKHLRGTFIEKTVDQTFLKHLADPSDKKDREYLYDRWQSDIGKKLVPFFESQLPKLQADDAANIRFVIANIQNGDILLKSKLMLHYVRARAVGGEVDEKTLAFANDNLLWHMLKDIDANAKLSSEYNDKFSTRKDAFDFYGLYEFVRSGSAMETALQKRFG